MDMFPALDPPGEVNLSCTSRDSEAHSDSSIDIDSFLGQVYEPPNPLYPTYKLVGDNIDKDVRPRNMTMEYQTRSLHYFHIYAVKDRINLSNQSDSPPVPNPDNLHLEELLPSCDDEQMMNRNFATLIGQCLVKYMPFFKKFGAGLERHIYHEYSEAMSKKSEVVRAPNNYHSWLHNNLSFSRCHLGLY